MLRTIALVFAFASSAYADEKILFSAAANCKKDLNDPSLYSRCQDTRETVCLDKTSDKPEGLAEMEFQVKLGIQFVCKRAMIPLAPRLVTPGAELRIQLGTYTLETKTIKPGEQCYPFAFDVNNFNHVSADCSVVLMQKITLPDIKFLRIYTRSLIKQLSNWKDAERMFGKVAHHSGLLRSQVSDILEQLSSTILMARENAEELEDQPELRRIKEKEAERLENAHQRLSEALDADQVCMENRCTSSSSQELSELINSEGQAVRAELEALDKFLKSEIERLEQVEAALIKQLNALRSELLKILSTNQ